MDHALDDASKQKRDSEWGRLIWTLELILMKPKSSKFKSPVLILGNTLDGISKPKYYSEWTPEIWALGMILIKYKSSEFKSSVLYLDQVNKLKFGSEWGWTQGFVVAKKTQCFQQSFLIIKTFLFYS